MSVALEGIQPTPPGSLQRRWVPAIVTGTALTVLYAIYSQTVSPFVVPGELEEGPRAAQVPTVPQPRINRDIARQYLANLAPWAEGAIYQLRTKTAFVYALNRETKNKENAIEFSPFAVVWSQKGWTEKGQAHQGEPYVIISDKAYIKFANAFEDITHSDPGRVIGGKLDGEVKISGPDGLKILGRDFSFSEQAMSLWSESRIVFAHGPHRGTADGLDAELIEDPVARAEDKLAVAGVKSVRLRKNVQLDLLFEENPAAEKPPAKQAPPRENDNPPVKVRILSDGNFHYGVQTHLATFEENVRVYRPTAPQEYDSLFCDKLTLTFEENPEAAGQTAVQSDNTGFKNIRSDLVVRRFQAEGERVDLISQANKLWAQMRELDYDVPSRIALLKHPDSVHVLQGEQGENQIHCPDITLTHKEDGTVSTVECNGPGRLQSADARTAQNSLSARWQKRMSKKPAPDSDQQIIELEQDAVVIQPAQELRLAAQLIRLWVRENETKDDSSPQGIQTADFPRPQPESKSHSEHFRLDRLLAETDVSLESRELNATTRKLEAEFAPAPSPGARLSAPAPRGAAAQNQRRLQPTLFQQRAHPLADTQPARGDSRRASNPAPAGTTPPGNRSHSIGNGREKESAPANGPMYLWADFIKVHGTQAAGRRMQIDTVWTEGNVAVQQNRAPGEEPLVITGEKMHLENRAEAEQVVHVFGKPARIRDPQMELIGSNLHLDRGENRVWVTGPGTLRLPVDRDLEGAPLGEPRTLDVHWIEKMNFDGRTARFFGNVSSLLDESRMDCHEMDVELTDRISFTEDQSRKQPDVSRVTCRHQVHFTSYEHDENKALTALRRGRFAHFVLDQTTGETLGTGPGWIAAWRWDDGSGSSPFAGGAVKANAAAAPEKAGWQYLRVDFGGKMTGNTHSRTTTFHDQVHVVHGPVEGLQDVVDPDNLPKKGGWMRSQQLHLTRHTRPAAGGATGQAAEYTTLQAEGNVKLNGRSFTAKASSVYYDESKGMYLLRSLAPLKAHIWRESKSGGEKSHAEAQSMRFWPEHNRLQLDQATSLQGVE